MELRNIVCGLAAVALLAGCSGMAEKKKSEYKAGTVQTQSLEVPPDLTTPESDQRYAIPGAEGGMVSSYSEYTKQKTEQPCVKPASTPSAAVPSPSFPPENASRTTSAPAPVFSAKLQGSNDNTHILLNEPFDRSWRRVGLALERAHIMVTDRDRSKGIYYVASLRSKDKNKTRQHDHLVTVREDQAGSDVAASDGLGKSGTESTRLIKVLYQNLDSENLPGGNPPPSGDGGVQPPR